MQRHLLFELAWILPSVAIPIGMLAALTVTNFGMHIQVPTDFGIVRAESLEQTAPFDRPGLVATGPGKYRLTFTARTWSFEPQEIRVPAGAEVEIVAASKDVTHGLYIEGTNVNLMLIPGRVARATARFKTPGEHFFLCHEYCGIAHHVMAGKIIVEAAP